MALSAAAYARQLGQLLPRGAALVVALDKVIYKLLLGVAEELARIDARADDMLNEADPSTTLELLEQWESVVGLPDPCGISAVTTTSGRQAAVVRKLVSQAGQKPQFFIDLCALLGFVVTITEYGPLGFRAGSRCGSRCGVAWAFAWQVNVDLAASVAAGSVAASLASGVLFRAGISRAGDRLNGRESNNFECIIRRASPAHTTVLFTYS